MTGLHMRRSWLDRSLLVFVLLVAPGARGSIGGPHQGGAAGTECADICDGRPCIVGDHSGKCLGDLGNACECVEQVVSSYSPTPECPVCDGRFCFTARGAGSCLVRPNNECECVLDSGTPTPHRSSTPTPAAQCAGICNGRPCVVDGHGGNCLVRPNNTCECVAEETPTGTPSPVATHTTTPPTTTPTDSRTSTPVPTSTPTATLPGSTGGGGCTAAPNRTAQSTSILWLALPAALLSWRPRHTD